MLEIRSLGGLSIRLDGAPVSGLASRKAAALLVYLAYTRVPHSREVLAEFLWEEQSQDQSLGNLRVALASLKAQIGPYLEITRQTLSWNLNRLTYFDAYELASSGAVVIKAREQRRPLGDDERAKLDAVLADYRGDFLHGFYLKDSVAFEEWSSLERERLRRFATEMLCSVADEAMTLGDYRRAAARASQLLLIDPTKEECHRKSMLALALAGDRSGALAQYERLKRVLADELDLEPEEETLALYQQIRDGHIGPRPETGYWEAYRKPLRAHEQDNVAPPIPKAADRGRLEPARPLTSFIGREVDLAELSRLLAVDRGRGEANDGPGLITLYGPGGSGKTRLALEVAAATAAHFPDGAVLLDLATVPEAGLLPGALAGALGVPEQPGADLVEMLCASLENKRKLLIFDGCEQLAEAAGELALVILQAAPWVRILVTSQVALGVHGEMRWQVGGLPAPQASPGRPLLAGEAAVFPAVQLFVERARAVNRSFVLADATVPAVVHICSKLDGMPLALELAAAQVKLLSPQQIADRLDDMFRLLLPGSPGSSHHNSLLAAMAWSCNLLNPTERILLRRLSVFRGHFALEAAGVVCSDAALAEPDLLPLLGSLVDKSFVVQAEQGTSESPRYRLLEAVRQYVAGWLDVAREVEAVRGRHLAFYANAAGALEERLRGPDQIWAKAQIERDYDNYREALAWGLSCPDACLEDGLRLVAALSEFWQRADRFDDARTWVERGLAAVERVPAGLQARVLSAAGTVAWLQGDYTEAHRRHALSLARAQQAGDERAVALAHNNLGVAACYQDRVAEARADFAEALAKYERLGDSRGTAVVLINLNLLAGMRGDYAAARDYGERSLPLWRKLGDDYQLATLLHNLGDLARIEGDFDRAKVLLEESIDISRKQNNRRLAMMSLTGLGRMALKQASLRGAASSLREGLVMSRDLGDKRGLAESVEAMAELAAAENRPGPAARLFGWAMSMLATIHTTLWLPDLLEHRAAVEAAQAALGHSQFAAEWASGSMMSAARVFELAMAQTDARESDVRTGAAG